MATSSWITTLAQGPEWYGLGLTLGAGEVRLDELTAAYAALLRGGTWRRPSILKGAVGESRRVVSEEAVAQVVDVLADPEARAPAFGAWSVLRLPFPASVKTGTSEGFHDNWAVGGNSEVVVGVWAGSFDRAPMGNVSGITGGGKRLARGDARVEGARGARFRARPRGAAGESRARAGLRAVGGTPGAGMSAKPLPTGSAGAPLVYRTGLNK